MPKVTKLDSNPGQIPEDSLFPLSTSLGFGLLACKMSTMEPPQGCEGSVHSAAGHSQQSSCHPCLMCYGGCHCPWNWRPIHPLSIRLHCSMLPHELHCSIPHTSAHIVPAVWNPCHSRDHNNSTAHEPGIIRIKPPNSPMQKLLLSSHFQVQKWRHRWMKALGAHSSWAAAGGHASNPVPDWTPPTCPAHVHARTTSPSPKAQSKDPRPLRQAGCHRHCPCPRCGSVPEG